MPISAPIDNRSSTILFRIPHVSKLLAFKDVLKNKDSLVKLITAILKLGLPEILYVGYDDAFSPKKDIIAKKNDAAIIRICLHGKELVRRNHERTIKMIISELQKPRNLISMASETLSHDKDIIAVAISVESLLHQNKYKIDCEPVADHNS
ncbi:hypothetical protein HUK80_03275 [Flavobacterium sp. MAH-1]|uniref:Uncharacterized protein n=1 Tax=Flavobacterium agri TaxID=2743471 RepID=A0A7Y8XZR6_9FLAO|nr:hypothetical protein [Flavobacterium agri]NUY79904.1 hypothetical protein [Flavobacterium agri]NYA69929.1 hypothetical protein [Flavobacterium agri]